MEIWGLGGGGGVAKEEMTRSDGAYGVEVLFGRSTSVS